MAKFKFQPVYAYGFEGITSISTNNAHTKATALFDGESRIIVYGKQLVANAYDGLVRGNVDKIVIVNFYGEEFLTVTGSYNAKKLGNIGNIDEFYLSLFDGDDIIKGTNREDDITVGGKGNDKIYGKAGRDDMEGGKGNDQLWGGKDQDYFIFNANDGKGRDVIMDFELNVDVLEFRGTAIDTIDKAGKNTLITLDNGGTVLLKGITKAEFLDSQQPDVDQFA